jgi:aminoglycoside phosphotransferase (APT) family kinase protein
MTTKTDKDSTDTIPVRSGMEFDEARLADWMNANVADFLGPLRVEQFRGGQSNPTYKLLTPERDYVLRRKPPGKLLRGAHAVEREARVMAALARSGFAVPKVLGVCEDEKVVGTPFFVMEMIAGRIFWDARFPDVSRKERPGYFDAMNDTLAALHCINPEAVGLSDYGRPGHFVERQIAIWSRQYADGHEAGRDPHMDKLVAWLPQNTPSQDRTTIVHGDFRCDNMVFHPTEPRVIAVLDWELSTLGDPLSDFAYHAMMYRMPSDIGGGLMDVDFEAMNIPLEDEYVEAYCRRTGRTRIPNYDFYIAFNIFRVAAILHGIKGRIARGNAASAQAAERSAAMPRLAELAWQQARRAGARQ